MEGMENENAANMLSLRSGCHRGAEPRENCQSSLATYKDQLIVTENSRRK